MKIFCLHFLFLEVLGQIFSHFFGEGRRDHPTSSLDFCYRLSDKVLNLAIVLGSRFHPSHRKLRINETSRPNHLLDNILANLSFVLGRSGRGKHNLSHPFQKLIIFERSVVECTWQTEAIINKRLLAGLIAIVHTAELRQCHMRLIDDGKEIGAPVRMMRKIRKECFRRITRFFTRKMP